MIYVIGGMGQRDQMSDKKLNGISTVEKFVEQLFCQEQFCHILKNISDTTAPTSSFTNDLIRKILTNRALLQVYANHIIIFDIKIDYTLMYKGALQQLYKIIELQTERKNIFVESITQNYSVKYANFSMDTLIESKINRELCVRLIVATYHLNPLATRHFLKKLRAENETEYSLLRHIDRLLA